MEHLGHLGWSEEQSDLLEVATKFCRERSPVDKVRSLLEDETGYDQAIWQEIVALGWLGIAIPEDYDGVGLSLAEAVPVMEQMGRYLMATPFASTTIAAQAILMGGTEAQKKTLLPKIIGGEVATVAFCEDNNDWDLANISASAKVIGDKLVLSGKKQLVCDGQAAQWIVISVLIDDSPQLLVVDASSIPKENFRRETIIDETRRSYEVSLDNVTVPILTLMDRDKTHSALKHTHLVGNLLAAAEMVGGTQAVIDYTIEYLNTRKQFGKLIGSYQALKHPTVDAFTNYEQARSHLYGAANSFNEQGTGEIATRMAKAQADKAYSFAADRAIQF